MTNRIAKMRGTEIVTAPDALLRDLASPVTLWGLQGFSRRLNKSSPARLSSKINFGSSFLFSFLNIHILYLGVFRFPPTIHCYVVSVEEELRVPTNI